MSTAEVHNLKIEDFKLTDVSVVSQPLDKYTRFVKKRMTDYQHWVCQTCGCTHDAFVEKYWEVPKIYVCPKCDTDMQIGVLQEVWKMDF